MKSIAKRSVAAFFATIGVLVVFGLIINFISDFAHDELYMAFGWGGILLTGLVGTPVHELSHWIACKLFGLNVHDVELFRPIADRTDGILGYVSYSYDSTSIWERLGCFAAGIAPLVFGGLFILLLIRFLTPEIYKACSDKIAKQSARSSRFNPFAYAFAAVSGFFSSLCKLRKWAILRGIVCLYTITSIAMHMSLSPQDLKGGFVGIIFVFAICFIYGIISHIFKTDYKNHLIKIASMLSIFLLIGVFFSLITLILSLIII